VAEGARYRFKVRVEKWLQRAGHLVFRQARSAFPDLVALKAGEKPMLVECRINGRISPEERERLLELAEKAGGRAFVASRKGRMVVFKELPEVEEAEPVRVRLGDFELNKLYEAADPCPYCGGRVECKVTYIDPEDRDLGDLSWSCTVCDAGDVDIVGWRQADKPVEFMGRKFYPLTHRANVGPCLACGRLVVGVPLILFLDKGRRGELDFCFPCVRKNRWDVKLFGARALSP